MSCIPWVANNNNAKLMLPIPWQLRALVFGFYKISNFTISKVIFIISYRSQHKISTPHTDLLHNHTPISTPQPTSAITHTHTQHPYPHTMPKPINPHTHNTQTHRPTIVNQPSTPPQANLHSIISMPICEREKEEESENKSSIYFF